MHVTVKPRFTGPPGERVWARYIGGPGKSNREIHELTHKSGIWGKGKGTGKSGDMVYRGPVNRGFTVLLDFISNVRLCKILNESKYIFVKTVLFDLCFHAVQIYK